MTCHVLVIDRDAGWAIEKHGPYNTRAEAESTRRRLRAQFAHTPALLTVRDARTANDSYEVRIIEHQDGAS